MALEDTKPTGDTTQDTDKGTDQGDAGASGDTTEDKIEVDLSDLTPDQKKLVEEKVKGFQADYTRKTQALKQKEKEMADDLEEGKYWKTWHADNKSGIEEYNASLEKAKDRSDAGTSSKAFDDVSDDVFGDEGVKKAMQANAETKKDLESQMTAGFNMLVDLVRLQNKKEYKDLDVDPKKVVEYAFKKKLTDMDEALQGCYRDAITEKTFKERLEAEKSKWEEKNKVNVLNTNMPMGRTPRKVLAKLRS